MKNMIASILFVSLVGSSLPTSGEVFKCVDEATGKTTFTDTACPDKGAGDYVPVKPANVDSGYASERQIEQSRREREARQQAKMAKWHRLADGQAKEERIAAHQKKSDRLHREARLEKDPWKRSALNRQADAEQRGALGLPPPDTSKSRAASAPSSPQHLIDPFTGKVMPRTGAGYVDPTNGTFYHDVGSGVVNTKTGEFTPTN